MRKLTLVLALTLGASVVRADNGLFYVGAGVTWDSLHDIAPNGLSLGNIDSTSWKGFAGVRPASLFAVEAEYMDLGSQIVNPSVEFRAHISYQAFAGYAVGFLPIPVPFLDVYGKAGLARWSSRGGVDFQLINAPPPSLSDNGTVFAWGVGSQVHAGNVGARLEYESFRIPSTNGANVVSLTVYLNLY